MEFYAYVGSFCKKNPGKGGYAYTVYDEIGEIWLNGTGNERQTTNDQMKLTAIIEALKTIDKLYQNYTVKVYLNNSNKKQTDSNQELWELLDKFTKKTNATFEKILKRDKRMQKVYKEAQFAAKSLK